jgi:hypothetical protein
MALPKPETGLVISYSYLWRHQSDAGQTEGVKDRPCVIVLAVKHLENGAPVVTVAPIIGALKLPSANICAMCWKWLRI